MIRQDLGQFKNEGDIFNYPDLSSLVQIVTFSSWKMTLEKVGSFVVTSITTGRRTGVVSWEEIQCFSLSRAGCDKLLRPQRCLFCMNFGKLEWHQRGRVSPITRNLVSHRSRFLTQSMPMPLSGGKYARRHFTSRRWRHRQPPAPPPVTIRIFPRIFHVCRGWIVITGEMYSMYENTLSPACLNWIYFWQRGDGFEITPGEM